MVMTVRFLSSDFLTRTVRIISRFSLCTLPVEFACTMESMSFCLSVRTESGDAGLWAFAYGRCQTIGTEASDI